MLQGNTLPLPSIHTKLIHHPLKRSDSGQPLHVQSTATVQSLDALVQG